MWFVPGEINDTKSFIHWNRDVNEQEVRVQEHTFLNTRHMISVNVAPIKRHHSIVWFNIRLLKDV